MLEELCCAECGTTEHILTHHKSYIPEITEILCAKCHGKKKRTPKTRGFLILKTYYPQATISLPKDIIRQLGELVELLMAPISPLGIIFPYLTPLKDVEKSLEIVLDDIRFRMRLEEDKKQQKVNSETDIPK